MISELSLFAQAFKEASAHEPAVYANLLRFVGIGLLFSASALAIMRFLDSQAKSHETFLVMLTARLLKIILGLTLFILILKP